MTKSGLPAPTLVLEITEQVMLEDTDLTARRLGELKALGIKLAIDDFGTGYSSMDYLRRLPFDILKIDKSFINGVDSEATNSALTAGIVNLARTLGLGTVAEGVERAEQVPELRRLGCNCVQGFFFAKPLPASVIDDMIAAAKFGKSWLPEVIGRAPSNDRIRRSTVTNYPVSASHQLAFAQRALRHHSDPMVTSD